MTNIKPEVQSIIDAEKNRVSAAQELVNQGLSLAKVTSMQHYAQSLRNRFPKMNANRIKQKVAAKYRIKIVDDRSKHNPS